MRYFAAVSIASFRLIVQREKPILCSAVRPTAAKQRKDKAAHVPGSGATVAGVASNEAASRKLPTDPGVSDWKETLMVSPLEMMGASVALV